MPPAVLTLYLYVSNRETQHPGLTFLVMLGYIAVIYTIIKLVNSRIFAKKPSNEWGHQVLRGKRSLFYYVYWLGVTVVMAQIGIYYIITYKPIYLDGVKIDDGFKYIWFYVAFVLLFVGLLNSYLVKTDTSFSDYPYLRYIIKVWVTNILAAPVLLTIILAQKGITEDWLPAYWLLVITSNGFGMLGFAAFAFNVHYISQNNWPERRKKMRIFISAELLTLVTVIVFALKSTMGISWFWLWLPYAPVMGFSIFYYKLDKPIPVEDAIVVED
ncbi:hypothetical protein BEL04_23075 [Mucilaginibacter sp. PPCGB 2223]|uniref:hypothetical protein n=1 Tax=Mucilaginibacter sp. PPCGB 2223 TaxID=1886027 RepID=UPI000826EBEE|nr:hypothetical protein [Mucilaginibacter sp. PPCGB 2223]OCX50655.1 hypothetical protein BEL04_23075 [Mucilaginibacter sp. PPCGB 2223]